MPEVKQGWFDEFWRKNMHELVNLALLLAGLVVLSRGAWLCVMADVPTGLSCLGAGLVLMLAATIDRFESLKGLGLEAKTREVVQRIEKADHLFAKLQDLAANVYAGIVKQAAGTRYWNTPYNEAELNRLAEQTRAQMRSLDISDDLIRHALAPWADEVLWRWVCVAAKPWLDAMDTRVKELTAEIGVTSPAGEDGLRRGELQLEATALQAFKSDQVNVKLFRHPRSDLVPELVRAMERTPSGVDSACHAIVLRTIEDWREELEFLQERRDLKTVSRWDEFIGWKRIT